MTPLKVTYLFDHQRSEIIDSINKVFFCDFKDEENCFYFFFLELAPSNSGSYKRFNSNLCLPGFQKFISGFYETNESGANV